MRAQTHLHQESVQQVFGVTKAGQFHLNAVFFTTDESSSELAFDPAPSVVYSRSSNSSGQNVPRKADPVGSFDGAGKKSPERKSKEKRLEL